MLTLAAQLAKLSSVAWRSLRPFGSRNFILIWSSALVSNIGSWMQTVALGTLVTLRTHSVLWSALTMAAAFIPLGLLAPLGGVLADRMDRRRLLIVTTLGEAASAVVLTILVGTHHDPVSALMAVVFCGSSVGALGFPAYQSILPEIVAKEDLLAAVSLSSAQWNLGRVVGPAIAGVLLVSWSATGAFAINAISFGAVVIALVMVELPHRVVADDVKSVRERFMEGVIAARRHRACRNAIVLISVVALIGAPFIGLVAAEAVEGLHRKAGGPAVLTTTQGIGAVIGAMVLAPLAHRIGHRRLLPLALGGFCVFLACYGAAPTLPLAALGIFLVGMAYIAILSGLNTVVQLHAPQAERGRILSIYMTCLGVIYPIGLVAEGAIGQIIGVRAVMVLAAVVLALVLLGLRLLSPTLFQELAGDEANNALDGAA